jgi:repressor LexA
MPTPLTKKQKEVMDYLTDFIESNSYAPSYREIAQGCGFSSVATVSQYIDILKSKGHLINEANEARSLQLTPIFDERTFEIPLEGSIAAGKPIEAIRTSETIDIPRDMMGRDVFALKVKGDSMVDDGILDGDYVIIQRCAVPRNGEIVVALLDNNNVTLKRFYQEKDGVRLHPSNSNYKPIRAKKVIIQGRVKGVIRKFRLS